MRATQQGSVRGFVTADGARAWLGIPFARPPLGELRWRAPQPPDPWQGTRDAISFSPSCAQFAGPGGGRDGAAAGEITGSEDCLYLNIYAPRFEKGAVPVGARALPVMLWIHGGGNTIGDATVYDGGVLAKRANVIVVTIHYRLGALGWFSHPSLHAADAGTDDRSGNYGTLDIVRALEWVQTNISAFGGDPKRVTVFGESAGGTDTYTMILSPRAKGLFARAIVESGGIWTASLSEAQNFVDDDSPGDAFSSQEVLLKHLVRDERAKDRESAKNVLARMSGAEIARYLRDKPAQELLSVYEGTRLGGMYSLPKVFRDGAVLLSGPPLDVLRRGEYNQVPVIVGTNRDESKLFMLFGSPYVTRVMSLPLWLNDVGRYNANAEYQTQMWKMRGVEEPAVAMRAVQGASVFAYRFDWDDEPDLLWLDLGTALGAAHALEIPFVFGRLSLGLATGFVFDEDNEAADLRLSDAIMSYWGEFAHHGDPGRGREGELPQWSSWSGGGEGADASGDFLVLDTEIDGGLRMAPSTLTRESIIARVAGDERLPSPRDRCEVYASFVLRGGMMSKDDYAAVEGGACEGFPVETYPWES